MRQVKQIYGNVFQGVVPERKRVNPQGEWYGIDVSNPSGPTAPPPWIQDRGEFMQLREMHQRLAQKLADELLIVERDDEDEAEPVTSAKF
jgi:hypothetical protein